MSGSQDFGAAVNALSVPPREYVHKYSRSTSDNALTPGKVLEIPFNSSKFVTFHPLGTGHHNVPGVFVSHDSLTLTKRVTTITFIKEILSLMKDYYLLKKHLINCLSKLIKN